MKALFKTETFEDKMIFAGGVIVLLALVALAALSIFHIIHGDVNTHVGL